MKPIGVLIKQARLKAKLSQVQLAKRMKMNQTKVSFYEGRDDMKWSLVVRFAKAMKVPLCELLECKGTIP